MGELYPLSLSSLDTCGEDARCVNKENGEHAQDREIYSVMKAGSQFGCPFWPLI